MDSLGYGAFPTHPGEILKNELEARNIPQRKFAEYIGISYSSLNDMLNGHSALTTTMALKFEAALNIPADSLMRLQAKYDLQTARTDKSLAHKLKEIAYRAALL